VGWDVHFRCSIRRMEKAPFDGLYCTQLTKAYVAKGLRGQRLTWPKAYVAKGLRGRRLTWLKAYVDKGLRGQRPTWPKAYVAKGLRG